MTITRTRPRGVGPRTAHDPGDPLVTSHCPFCGSGQVVGRSDGTIGCDFCGQAYIVRVQPAFPGMPQMPNGPGAPSDVGPDGMVDPGMIGPDGMPMAGGPPPGEGDPDGDGPPGAVGGDDDSAPDDDGKEDDSDSGPPPKGKSKKKSALYRGVQGQPLTEDQLIRHMAVVASGRDPAVMARLRATAKGPRAARRVVAAFPDDLAHYRTLSSGHQVSLGRHGPDWYGIVSAPHPHDRHWHMMSLGREGDPGEAAERELSRGPARDFVHATTDWSGAKSGNPVETPGAAPGRWWNSPQRRTFEDPIFHSASAEPHRGRRPFEIMAAWEDSLLPGDAITGREQGNRLRGMREHMRGLGFPVQDTDSHGYEQLGPSFPIRETGHQVSIGHSRRDQTWVAHVHHPDDNGPEKTIATVNLGLNAEHVPHLLTREMGSRPVVDELRRQWGRAAAGRHEYPGPRRPRDWGPHAVHFTARGAQLPQPPEEEGYVLWASPTCCARGRRPRTRPAGSAPGRPWSGTGSRPATTAWGSPARRPGTR